MPLDLSVATFERYLETYRPLTTVRTYGYAARLLVAFVQEHRIDIHRTPGALLPFVTWLVKVKKVKPGSINAVVPGAIKYLEWRRAMGDQLPQFVRPDKPKNRREPPKILQDAALEVYRRVVERTHDPGRTLMLILPLCGLRSAEACSLHLSQIQHDPGSPGRLMISGVEGKSRDLRDVNILDPGTQILYGYLTGWRKTVSDSPWLFPSTQNTAKPYNIRTLRTHVDRVRAHVRAALGLRSTVHLTSHVLRRTWVTKLVRNGVPLTQVAELAGHQSIQTTYQHYVGREEPGVIGANVSKIKGYLPEEAK